MEAIFHTEEINSYGFWIKSEGIKLERFKKNPVLLYNHDSSRPAVGKISNLQVKDGELIGEVEFDEGDELGRELKRKYEKGYMQGFSIGIRPLKFSESEEDIKKGQTMATVTEAELFEISAVNLPSNENAVALYDQNGIKLSTGQLTTIPKLTKEEQMEKIKALSAIAGLLGLSQDAGEREITEAIGGLKEQTEQLQKELKELKARHAELIVELGAERGVITESTREQYMELASEKPETVFAIVKGASKETKEEGVKLSTQVKREVPQTVENKKWEELSASELLELKEKHFEQYKKLYREYYGFYPEEINPKNE